MPPPALPSRLLVSPLASLSLRGSVKSQSPGRRQGYGGCGARPQRRPAEAREAVEALIQELAKFMLKAVPTDCTECPICLEEFKVGNEVHGLPCAHNFHVECIDQWLRLNVKCPRCRCSVFPNLDLSALKGIRSSSEML
ncbi:hypothetical protein ZWY2020_048800 [Hordeum vulgare]|nr:hypothetical protein ZWY2020_048800 [Hordeum vulgare]